MHLLVAAASGWGKGYIAQILADRNIRGDRYDRVVVLDTSNEFRGLVLPRYGPGPASHWNVRAKEHHCWTSSEWAALVEDTDPALVLGRSLPKTQWREAVAEIVLGCRRSDLDVLVVIDEGHGVAPQREGYPKPIRELATDGRTEGGSATSSIWITQRPAQLDKTVVGNCTARFLGGFETANDLSAVKQVLEYPVDLHSSGGQRLTVDLSDDLRTDDGEAISVRKWTETDESGEPQTVNSEWIYSDETGEVSRKESDDYDPRCAHVGARGKRIDVGV